MLGSIRHCPECGSPLRGRVSLGLCPACTVRMALAGGTAEAPTESHGNDAERGTTFGDYELLGEIARGGMGVVYRARQRSLGRIVALKVLLGGAFAGEDGRRRLRTEAAAAARLSHPNLVAVHEAGVIDGQPYYSMEFVEGRTLADELRNGSWPPGRAARCLAALAEAVQHAHDHGVLHRDLKPSNVLLDARDQPRIADFGLAHPLATAPGGARAAGPDPLDTTPTLTGQVLGSPAYMAPEQAYPTGREPGPAIDVYSLGSILYELLAARPPFQGPTPQAVLAQLRDVEPVAPRRLDATVPRDLETLCLKCLEKDPARRYPTAGELASDLHRFLRGEPVRARPVGPAGRAWRWARRRPVVAGLGLALVVTLASGLGLALAAADRLRDSRDTARRRLAESLVSEARALRLASASGHRERALERIDEARRLDPDGRLRDKLRREGIAALAGTDVQRVTARNLPPSPDMMLTAFDPTFERCAIANPAAREVAVHRVRDGAVVGRLRGRTPDEVLGFDARGRFLALRFGGATALWDASEGDGRRLLAEEDGEGTGLGSGAFSADGLRFGRAERERRFVVYQLDTNAPSRAVRERDWPLPRGLRVGEVRWSPDGASVAMSLEGDRIVVCNAVDGTPRWEVHRADGIGGLAWIPDRGALAVCTRRDSVVLFDGATGDVLGPAGLPVDTAEAVAVSPRGDWVAVATERFGTRLHGTDGGWLLGSDPAGAWHLQFDAEGGRVGTLLDDGHPAWLEIHPSQVLRRLGTGLSSAESVLGFSRDGRTLVTLARDGVQFWDVATSRRRLLAAARHVVGATLTAGEQQLVFTAGGELAGIDLPNDAAGRVEAWQGPRLARGQRFWGVAAAPRRGWIAVADHVAGTVRIVGSDGAPRHELAPFPFPAYVAFSPDERWLACGGPLNAVIWDLDATPPGEVRRFRGVGERVSFSPGGRWLLATGRELNLWRTGTWESGPALPLEPNNAQGLAAAFSPDDRLLAATQLDREIHLVALDERRTFAVLEGPGEGRVTGLAFSPDGRHLAAARDRGEVQVWDLVALRAELERRHLAW